jgi:DNA-binding NtrC family response regulator
MRTVLIADDDDFVRKYLRDALKDADCHVVEAGDGKEASAVIASESPDLVLLDLLMPNKSGLEVLAEYRKTNPSGRVVVISAMDATGLVAQAMEQGAFGFIQKPFHRMEVASEVRRALAKS